MEIVISGEMIVILTNTLNWEHVYLATFESSHVF